MDFAIQFRALGDSTRLAIVECLASCGTDSCELTAGEVCCGVTGQTTITPTVSHHIKELKLAGLVKVDRRGRHMFCSLDRHALGALAKHLEQLSQSGENNDCC